MPATPVKTETPSFPKLTTLTGAESVRLELNGKLYDAPLSALKAWLEPLAPAYATPTFQDNFQTLNLMTFDGAHWPPPAGSAGTWSPMFFYGWPTNTGQYPGNIGGLAARMETSQGPGANNDAQCYEASALSIDVNGLVISATLNSNNHGQCPWTSGLIAQNPSLAFSFGYYEMVAKLPAGQGLWPAFWLLDPDGWPPEIDILEFVSLDANNVPTVNQYHINTIQTGGAGTGGFVTPPGPVDLTAGYHKYAANVTPTGVIFYFDDQEIAQQPLPEQITATTKLYMVANLCVGGPGSWPGQPAAGMVAANLHIARISSYAAGSWGSAPIPLTPPAPH